MRRKCPLCGGTDRVTCGSCDGAGQYMMIGGAPGKCYDCDGAGTIACPGAEAAQGALRVSAAFLAHLPSPRARVASEQHTREPCLAVAHGSACDLLADRAACVLPRHHCGPHLGVDPKSRRALDWFDDVDQPCGFTDPDEARRRARALWSQRCGRPVRMSALPSVSVAGVYTLPGQGRPFVSENVVWPGQRDLSGCWECGAKDVEVRQVGIWILCRCCDERLALDEPASSAWSQWRAGPKGPSLDTQSGAARTSDNPSGDSGSSC